MRRITALLLMLLLLPGLVAAEDDFDLDDILSDADPDVVKNTYSQPGNSKPSDMSSFMFQTRWRIRDDEITNEGFRIIPIRISSRTDRNDFTPTVFGDGAARDAVLTTLKNNGKSLEYVVSEYPLEWKE